MTTPLPTAEQLQRDWNENPRWSGITRGYGAADVVVATAAVSDFRPATTAADKVKKQAAELRLDLEPNPDILAELGQDKGGRILVGFAAETQDCLTHAAEKLTAKRGTTDSRVV